MKFLKDNWFMLLLIIAVVVLFRIVACNTQTSHSNEKAQNDSLKTAMSNLNDEVNRVVEKLSEANHSFEIKIEQDQKDRQLILSELSKLKNKHETTVIDTTKCCEQLVTMNNDFTNYIAVSDSEIAKSNSIISAKDSIITNQDSINTARLIFNNQLQSSFKTATDNYNNLYKDYGKQDKKLKWFKVKETSLIVLLIGSLIYSATK